MSSLLKTVAAIMAATPKLTEWLPDAAKYLAHTHQDKPSEKFEEHVLLVDRYFVELCEAHGLDSVINKLIRGIVEANFSAQSQELIAGIIKDAFVAAVHFHDFGKVNENFQADPKKMNNPLFRTIPNHPIGTKHSELGAYLFVMKHLQDTSKLKIEKNEMMRLHLILLLMSYTIIRHHAPELSEPTAGEISFKEEVKTLKEYIRLYQFDINPALAEHAPLHWQKYIFDQFDKLLQTDFPLFALLKLHFSLLTAADYLATHQYMTDAPTTDLGILNNRERVNKIVENLRAYHHNAATFKTLSDFRFEHPTVKSLQNLNQLRREMAVEVIRTIRENPDKNLYYIEAPTGGGKTNLSMIAITELLEMNPPLTKIYYVFPFTTLITQTYKVLQDTLGLKANELVQLHSKADFPSKQEGREDGVYGAEKKDFIDNLFALYPITVLSHVKFFDVLKSNRKEQNYLLHRLANSIVIVDELQSYNPSIWDKLLYFITQYAEYFNVRFVLMSATLPKISSLEIALENKPVFTDLIPEASRYLRNPNFADRVRFNFELFEEEIDAEKLAEFVIHKSEVFASNNKRYGSVHTIIEFIYKKSASAFYQCIREQTHPFDQVFVLSGTILEPRRKQIINFLKNKENRGKNVLLITTQVVEAGVDIDMDLGFKNVSLIDSDEQLAGRVNRNADKEGCEVYLFKMDNAKVLYSADERFKVSRDKNLISEEQYQRILQEKDFGYLYNHVFAKLDQFNNLNYIDNFRNGMLSHVKSLNFKEVNRNFKIIDQQNESVFVPLFLPISIESIEPGKADLIFSKDNLSFLETLGAFNAGDETVNGAMVWSAYEQLIQNRSKNFNIKDKVDFKMLQSIMSKFTFSLVANSKMITKLREFCLNADLTYGYYYLSHHEAVYSEEAGLLDSQFEATENYFL
jgi:CRISPR-associated endonuclease/helicase Cas3